MLQTDLINKVHDALFIYVMAKLDFTVGHRA